MAYNPGVSFIVIGDAAPPALLPPNVHFETVSYPEMQARQHAQSAPLAAPQLGACASSGCAWLLGSPRKWPAHWVPSPPPRLLEPAASIELPGDAGLGFGFGFGFQAVSYPAMQAPLLSLGMAVLYPPCTAGCMRC